MRRSIAWHPPRSTRTVLLLLMLLACVPSAQEEPLAGLVGDVSPGSEPVGCERASQLIALAHSAHLDPSCTYTRGVEIHASDVVLDCRGARIEDTLGTRSRGIVVTSPSNQGLSNVTIRNCIVKGFLNNLRVTRDGFKSLLPGEEYETPISGVRVENSRFHSARGSGIFVDGYVTDVTLSRVTVAGAGSVGVYLEAGSRDNVVEDSEILDNGFGDVVPGGVPFDLGGVILRYRSTGREGIAIDGSRGNRIVRNVIAGNSAGGIFLYKNCGEYFTEKPRQWWERRTGADDNRIEDNWIHDANTGIWIGSRMAENQFFMDCSDPAYASNAFFRIHRDRAAGNVVRGNLLTRVLYGVRVEDDRSRVEDNWFFADDPAAKAILLGTKERTLRLGEPVEGTDVSGNHAVLRASDDPFAWIHGHRGTRFEGNLDHSANPAGAPAELVPGTQPPIDPFLFVITFWAAP